MLRTCAPTATTSAHTSRFDTWAVAGMRMPARERRSPSLWGICTRTRSFSILMGCLPSAPPSLTEFDATVCSLTPEPVTEHLRPTTADGFGLEAELRVPAEPWGAAVILHPHPRQGGTMHSLVCAALFDAFPGAGVAALRFTFRGVGGSEGTHGRGRDEAGDCRAALDALYPVLEGVPFILAG